MKKLLLLLLCVPLIGFGQAIPTIYAESINKIYDTGDLIDWDLGLDSIYDECFCVEKPLHCFNPSSVLPSQGRNNYSINNMNDNDPKTAWVEGVSGYGIGESFMMHVDSSGDDRWSWYNFLILNGFQHSIKIWKQNSRVKKFKVYFDGRSKDVTTIFDFPICFLVLEDKMGYQEFDLTDAIYQWMETTDLDKVDPGMAGFSYTDYGHFIDYVLVFEIVEVYKGDKWSDVAISGIGTFENCCTEAR